MASYHHTNSRLPAIWQTIPDKLKYLAEEQPDKLAFVVYKDQNDRQEITRKAVYDGSVKFAKALVKFGIKKRDYVAVSVGNCVDLMIYNAGVIMAGAISVSVAVNSLDIGVLIQGCKAVIFDSKEALETLFKIAQISDNSKIVSEIFPELRLVISISNTYCPPNVLSATKLMTDINDSEEIALPYLDPEDIVIISKTSGTTGQPKDVYHSHFSWLNCAREMMHLCNITSDDVTYSSRPMLYIGGYPFGLMTVGTTHVTGNVKLLNDNNNLKFIQSIWEKERCNILWLLPQHLKLFRNCGYLSKVTISGGDMLTNELVENSLSFSQTVAVVYGSSEATFVGIRLFSKENISEHIPKMIGKPMPDTEVKIVDDNVKTLNIGEVGNIYIRNKWTSKGNVAGASLIKNGWQPMSDIGYMTQEGDIFMIGRDKDFIKKYTVKLSIKAIEEYVSYFPGVLSVVVVPIPDEEVGERVCACVTIESNHEFNEEGFKQLSLERMRGEDNIDIVSMIPDYFLQFIHFPLLASQKFDRTTIKSSAIAQIVQLNKDRKITNIK